MKPLFILISLIAVLCCAPVQNIRVSAGTNTYTITPDNPNYETFYAVPVGDTATFFTPNMNRVTATRIQ